MRFFLGTHRPGWLWNPDAPFALFVSHRTLGAYKTLRPATHQWALDSGGFTELSMHGAWVTSPGEYVAAVTRYADEVGCLSWAAPQDWMCEPFILAKTGATVEQHQHWTLRNYLDLRMADASLPFIPVLQGWAVGDYLAHADMYDRAGIDLAGEKTVGLGSVCRRQGTAEISHLIERLAPLNLHGFGLKTKGLLQVGHRLVSADSLAWSYAARRGEPLPGCGHKSCANCLRYAVRWRDRLLARLYGWPVQDPLDLDWEAA